MRIYRGIGPGQLQVPYAPRSKAAHYIDVGLANDSWAAVNSNEKPGRPTPTPVGYAARREAARVTRFWRRFHSSTLRDQLRGMEKDLEKRYDMLVDFLNAFAARYPSRMEMNQLASWLKRWGEGKTDENGKEWNKAPGSDGFSLGRAFVAANLVQQYLPHIPESVMKLASIPEHGEWIPSDDDAVRMEVKPADLTDPMPRERFTLPRGIRMEKWSRRGLTKWEWQVPTGESPKAHVQFLLDSSGSMGANKMALALAAAVKLKGRLEADGHTVHVRFASELYSPLLDPEDAIAYALTDERQSLGGGDRFQWVLKKLLAENPDVTDWVVFSDFCIQGHPNSTRSKHEKIVWPEEPSKLHAILIDDPGDDSGIPHPWWKYAASKHDYRSLLGLVDYHQMYDE